MSKKKRGFANLTPEQRTKLARLGGLASHKAGTAHQFTQQEAKDAGRKGGQATSKDRKHMAEIGRKGGLNKRKKK